MRPMMVARLSKFSMVLLLVESGGFMAAAGSQGSVLRNVEVPRFPARGGQGRLGSQVDLGRLR